MKNLTIIIVSSLMIGLLSKSEAFVSNITEYCVEDYQEHLGVLTFSKDKKTIFLNRDVDSSKIKLEFAYDNAEDMVIDDLGLVSVSGYYSRIHRVLFVEKIIEPDCPML